MKLRAQRATRIDVDLHLLAPDGDYLLYSDDMKPYAQIAAERRQAILDRKQLVPNGTCHYCGYAVPKLAHWCGTPCAQDYAAEKEALSVRSE